MQRKDIYYLLCGVGVEQQHLEEMSEKLGVRDQIHFLGYRSDVSKLYQAADVFALPSFREGLSRSLMEAMASGLPCIVSDIRGNTDLVDKNGGALFDPHNVQECQEGIEYLLNADMKKLGIYNMERIKEFEIGKVEKSLLQLYKEN